MFRASILALFALPAAAQERCASEAALRYALTITYGEHVVSSMPCNLGTCQLWRSDEANTFTWLVILDGGVACILADGVDTSEAM